MVDQELNYSASRRRKPTRVQRWADYLHRNRRHWLALAMVLTVCAYSVLIGWNPSILFLLPLVAGLGIWLIPHISGAVFPFVIVGVLLVPFTVGTGTGSEINVAMITIGGVAGVWFLKMVTQEKRIRLPRSAAVPPLLALLTVAGMSFLFGQMQWSKFAQNASIAAQLGGLALFLLSVLAFLWVGGQVRDRRWLQAAVWVFLAIGGLYILGRTLPSIGQYIFRLFPGGIAGSLLFVWLAALSSSQLLYNQRLHPVVRLGLVALLVALFYVAYVERSAWKSGWVPSLIAVAVIVALRSRTLAILVLLSGLVFIFGFSETLLANDDYSVSTRLEAWRLIAEIIELNPLLGIGPANYYYYTALLPIRGYYVEFNSHNQYIDLVAQVGFAGLLCYLWFFAAISRVGWSLRHKITDDFGQAYVYGALGGIAGMIAAGVLGDWILPFVYNVGLRGFHASVLGWLFLGGLVALQQMSKPAEESDTILEET